MDKNVKYAKGLEGVIAAESHICKIDGEAGELYYLGYPISALVNTVDFEEVVYLLLNGELPTQAQFMEFRSEIRRLRHLKSNVLNMIRDFPRQAHVMELLQPVISYLANYADAPARSNPRDALHLVPQLSSVIAAFYRFREGKEYVPPRDDLCHGANFLYMLRGIEPSREEGEIMDKCLVLHAEHSFNASTFTARVVTSTQSTCYASVSAAIGALYGSLHGGANERVIEMLDEISSEKNVDTYIAEKIRQKKKIMGMGHRVYRAKDPRAVIMESLLEQIKSKESKSHAILRKVEKVFCAAMGKKGKPIYPNVDFYSGAVYRTLGIPNDLFTPIFAAARMPGWLAHIIEQQEKEQRLFRPKALYVGVETRTPAGLAQR